MKPKIHKTAVIYDNVKIGDDVVIGAYAVIGSPPEHRDYYAQARGTRGVVIEDNARIFEFVTIHAGTRHPTIIGEGSAVFNHSHIAHDVELGSRVTVGGHSSLAGHVTVMDGALVSGRVTIAPWCVVGAFAMVGMGSLLSRHVPPGEKWIGAVARHVGLNLVAMERAGKDYNDVLSIYGEAFKEYVKGSKL